MRHVGNVIQRQDSVFFFLSFSLSPLSSAFSISMYNSRPWFLGGRRRATTTTTATTSSSGSRSNSEHSHCYRACASLAAVPSSSPLLFLLRVCIDRPCGSSQLLLARLARWSGVGTTHAPTGHVRKSSRLCFLSSSLCLFLLLLYVFFF